MGKEAAFPKWLWDVMPTEPATRHPPRIRRSLDIPQRPTAPPSVAERYDELVRRMKVEHHIRVAKWRTRNTGCAWQVHYDDGTTTRLIEAPYPRGPVSCAVFLHEVGHHAIGFYTYKPRCWEEWMAWRWSLDTMRSEGFAVTGRVEQMVEAAMRYAVAKAVRRGIKRMPADLAMFLPPTHRVYMNTNERPIQVGRAG